MSEVAEKTAEVVAENVEEAIDGVVEVVEVFRNNPVLMAGFWVGGLAIGLGAGYLVAKKQLKTAYEQLATEELADAKAFYANLYKVNESGDNVSPQAVMEQRHGTEAAAEAVRTYQGRQAAEKVVASGDDLDRALDEQDEAQIRRIEEARLHSVNLVAEESDPVEVVETRNVFVDPTFDLEEELKHRTKNKPYVITHDEYFAAEKEYETQSLTYFEVDDTLTNERDEPLREIDKMVGEDHLVRFGHGSKDKNIVYVRNDRLETDFEIIKSTGSYLEEVLGLPGNEHNALKHSDQRDLRRAFRHGDG